MALNWDAFLNPESIDIPPEPWSDYPPPTHTPHASQMPKSVSTDTSGSSPEDLTSFDTLLSGVSADPYLEECLFVSNDYFLSDLEVLQPFTNNPGGKSTSASSPESSTNMANSSQPNPDTMLPDTAASRPIDQLTYPSHPADFSSSSKPNTTTSHLTADTTSKRAKNNPDVLSACWTSPLCPNHDQDGPPPNPSTCGGGCAPFLFADQGTLPALGNLLPEPQEITAEDGIVEIQPRPKKRAESDSSSSGVAGRTLERKETTSLPREQTQRMKSEGSDESPAKESPPANDDPKPKSRRRLPHNQVERKYRESLNTQMESLRRVVPTLQQDARACDSADIEDLPTTSKPSKAVILASATAYIKQQEKDKKSLAEENQLLRTRVKALQALVKCDDCSLMQYVMDLKLKQGG